MLITHSKLASIKQAVQQKAVQQQKAVLHPTKPASLAAKAIQHPAKPASNPQRF